MKPTIVICFIFLGFCQLSKGEDCTGSNDLPDYLINVSISSIQDVLSMGIEVNDKIVAKIINLTSELFHDEIAFSAIKWNTSNDFVVKRSIPLNYSSAKVLFHDFSVHCDISKRFSTSMTCNTPKNITLEVELPPTIVINADILIMQPYLPDTRGSITMILEKAKIMKHSDLSEDDSDSALSLPIIHYENSQVHLRIEKKFQKLIYEDSGTILDEAELLLTQFFAEQLDEELKSLRSIFLATCPKMISSSKEQGNKKSDLFNAWYFKDVYVIPSSTSEWEGVKLTIGPIIIDGLSHFNNTGPSVHVNDEVSYDLYGDRRENTVERYVRLRSGALRGKLELSFDVQQVDNQDDTNSSSVYSFVIDYVQFETKFEQDRGANVMRKTDMKFGQTRTKLFQSNSTCVRRNQFIDNVISENLKSVIKNSLLKSVAEKWKIEE